jgi:hypothetical protein
LQGLSGDGQNFFSQQAKIIPDHRGVVHARLGPMTASGEATIARVVADKGRLSI